MVSLMWCVHINFGQHDVVLTHSPSEQFEHFKAEHADCDVSKVGAVGAPACAVSVGVHTHIANSSAYILSCTSLHSSQLFTPLWSVHVICVHVFPFPSVGESLARGPVVCLVPLVCAKMAALSCPPHCWDFLM